MFRYFLPMLLIAGIVFLSLPGCGDDDTTYSSSTPYYYEACSDPAPDDPIIPVSYGRIMVYRFTGYDPDGEVDTIIEDYEYQVYDEFNWGGVKWYAIGSCDGSCPETAFTYASTSYARNCAEGYCVGNGYDGYLMYKYPIDSGESYFAYPDGAVEVTLVSKTVEISVPLGIFQCYQYRHNHPSYDNVRVDRYVVPGIEMIKMEVYDEANQHLAYTWELKQLGP